MKYFIIIMVTAAQSNYLSVQTKIPTPYGFKLFHKWGNFILWGLLADIGIMLIQYSKGHPYRLRMHGYLMGTIVSLSFIASSIYIYLKPDKFTADGFQGLSIQKQFHLVCGVILMFIMLMQVLCGLFLRYIILKLTKQQNTMICKRIHTVMGHCIYLIGKIEAGVGMYISYSQSEYFILFWISYIGILVCRIALHYYNIPILTLKSKQQTYVQHSNEIIEQSNYVALSQQFEQDKLWCVFNNQILDLSNIYHPGGMSIWQAIKGQEISKYIYGGQPLDGINYQYKHSQYAITMLQQLVIGQLKCQLPIYRSVYYNIERWQITNKIKINDYLSQFTFKSNITLMNLHLQNIQPNHYVFVSNDDKINVRSYTLILSMQKCNIIFRQNLIDYFEYRIESYQRDNHGECELQFYIKNYNKPKNSLSCYFHENIEQTYQLKGPYQSILQQFELNSHIVLICGGTGLFPFIDLLNYLLQMTICQIMKQNKRQYPNEFDCPFHQLKITMYLSVNDKSDIVGLDIINSLLKYQYQLQDTNFVLILKSKYPIQGMDVYLGLFNSFLFEQHIMQDTSRIYICGPTKMSQYITKELQYLGINMNRIQVL